MTKTSTTRGCSRCKRTRPLSDYLDRGRLCSTCRADDDAPRVSEADWQRTIVETLNVFGWSHMHVRRTKGRHGWTTSTSADGWPDLTAMRGGLVLGIELKADDGKPTSEQLEWLARFARLVGGRAWILRPNDPPFDTIVSWLRDPANGPRRHGW